MPWPMFQQVERQSVRMHQVMRRLDVDTVQFVRRDGGEAYARARKTCLSCSTCDLCLRWLDGASRQDRLPDFCPNLGVFLKCQRASADPSVRS